MRENKNNGGKKNRFPKSFVLLASLLAVTLGIIGGTVAWLTSETGPVTNTFTMGTVTPDIPEKIDNGVKKDVKVGNTGTVPAYVRASVVITWKNADGEVYGVMPQKGTDYSITYCSDASQWVESDGIWYCVNAVPAGEDSPILIKECKKLSTPPEGYDLSVEILAQSIQSVPDEAAEDAWGVTVTNGSLVIE